ncbi:hypothetical protein [Acetivibrio straminisolvens]|nr:hypothetical protein [Acetivibrio straminisolvens]
MKTYIFSRKTGTGGTKIMEIDKKEAIQIMKENRNKDYQLGILTGSNFDVVIKVYSEYAPFHKVNTVQELIRPYEKTHSRLRRIPKSKVAHLKCRSIVPKTVCSIRRGIVINCKQNQ